MMFLNEHYTLKPITQAQLKKDNKASQHLIDKIKKCAGGSFFRLNAKTADCYAFDFTCEEWCGGWDWSKTLVDAASYIYIMRDRKFYKVIYK